MKLLYYYCSMSTFKSIIEKSSLWLTDIAKSNDSMELKWISTLFKDEAKSYFSEIAKHKNYSTDDNFFENINVYIDRCINRFFYENPHLVLAICFSEKDDLLSQWRGYADNGNGVSIGFNADLLKLKDGIDWRTLQVQRVVYDIEKQKEFVRRVINWQDVMTNSPSVTFLDYCYERIKNAIAHLASEENECYKNPAFEEECEWRLSLPTYTHPNYHELGCDKNAMSSSYFNFFSYETEEFAVSKLSYYSKINKLIPYVELNFDKIKNDFVKEVIIGPACDMSEYDVRLFVNNAGIHIGQDAIRKSNASYRVDNK